MIAPKDSDPYRSTVRRIAWLTIAIGAAGAVAAAMVKGVPFGAGFAAGAALSGLSLWRWTKVVESLGGAPRSRSGFIWIVRFTVLAAAAYVIVKYLGINPAAVLLGLLVSAAAVIVEIIYELIYGT